MNTEMKQRYRKFKRGWGVYHVFDNATGLSKSLDTRNRQEAERLVHAMNEAERQPILNRQIARAYLMAADPGALTRTWQSVMAEKIKTVGGSTLTRWQTAIRDKAYLPIRNLKLVETRAEHFREVLQAGTVATNLFLRKLHNFALDMNWLLGPVLVKAQWPKVRFKEKRGITLEEHEEKLAARCSQMRAPLESPAGRRQLGQARRGRDDDVALAVQGHAVHVAFLPGAAEESGRENLPPIRAEPGEEAVLHSRRHLDQP